jgi:hypothetical protein
MRWRLLVACACDCAHLRAYAGEQYMYVVVSPSCMMQLLSQDDDGVYGASVQFIFQYGPLCFVSRRTRPSYKIGLVWRS